MEDENMIYKKAIDAEQACDVLVVGGGPAGVCAAVSAARQGVKTILVERFGVLGGMMTAGHVDPILGSVAPGTMYDEVVSLLAKAHPQSVTPVTRNGREVPVDAEEAKTILQNLVHENGVQLFLQTTVIDVLKEENRVAGIVLSTPTGLMTIRAKCIVDATGDGFVAMSADAEYKVGRDGDGHCQPVTLEFIVDQVDESRAITCFGGSDPVCLPDGRKYAEFCKEANQAGELPKNVTIVRLHRTHYAGERSVNATQANGFDTLTPEGVFGAEIDLRAQIGAVVAFLRKNVPGYSACRLKASGSSLGVRETRRIMGDRMIQDSDVENGTKQDDVVVHNAWFLIDIHNPTGGGQAEGHSHPAIPFDIPYGALLPRKLDDLLTCGRCISGTHRAHAAYRVMAICMATGQAAGVAAALSAKAHTPPRSLDIRELQSALEGTGAVLFDK